MGGTGTTALGGPPGLGGTGIVGVVTGFGSVCVNGMRLQMAGAYKEAKEVWATLGMSLSRKGQPSRLR